MMLLYLRCCCDIELKAKTKKSLSREVLFEMNLVCRRGVCIQLTQSDLNSFNVVFTMSITFCGRKLKGGYTTLTLKCRL